jgi:hypothetical protein
MPRKKKTNKARLERVSVRAELRSEPDWDKFAWALLQYTRLLSDKQPRAGKKRPKP